MLPQLATLLARCEFLEFSLPALVGKLEPLDWTRPPAPRCEASGIWGPLTKATCGALDFRAVRAQLGATKHALLEHAVCVKEVRLHRVASGVYVHKAPVSRGDLVTLEDEALVEITTLFTWKAVPFFVGLRWSRDAATQDRARVFHVSWGRTVDVVVGPVSSVLGKAWCTPARGRRVTHAPYLERHQWW